MIGLDIVSMQAREVEKDAAKHGNNNIADGQGIKNKIC